MAITTLDFELLVSPTRVCCEQDLEVLKLIEHSYSILFCMSFHSFTVDGPNGRSATEFVHKFEVPISAFYGARACPRESRKAKQTNLKSYSLYYAQ